MDVSNIDQIIEELDKQNVGVLPEQALRAAQERREEITPRLIELLRKATEAVRAGGKPAGDGHLFALFLLAEFRATEALPAILDAISLPGDGPFTLFGDAITEDLSRILLSCADDPLDVIDRLLVDRTLNEYVRWEAAQAYLLLVREGELTRGEAVARLRIHLLRAIAQRDSSGVGVVISELICYSPFEAVEDIEEAFRLRLVDTSLADRQSVRASIEGGDTCLQEALEHCRSFPIQDTVAELRRWACFQPRRPFVAPPLVAAKPVEREAVEPLRGPATTVVFNDRRVGRNDPCPCGSGKKFKKCCLSKA